MKNRLGGLVKLQLFARRKMVAKPPFNASEARKAGFGLLGGHKLGAVDVLVSHLVHYLDAIRSIEQSKKGIAFKELEHGNQIFFGGIDRVGDNGNFV